MDTSGSNYAELGRACCHGGHARQGSAGSIVDDNRAPLGRAHVRARLGLLELRLGPSPDVDAATEDALADGASPDAGTSPSDATTDTTPPPDLDATPPGSRLRVFVTAETWLGTTFGADTSSTAIGKADAFCAEAALRAGLNGTFRAWLSTSKSAAVERFEDYGPWYDVARGHLVIARPSAFVALAAIPDELGKTAVGQVWIGARVGANCGDFTASAGSARVGDPNDRTTWDDAGDAPCGATQAHLCCFEVP